MDEFHLVTYAQEIVSGAGSIAQLPAAVERFGWQRLLLCASPSLQRDRHFQVLQRSLGAKLVTYYDHVQAHVQDYQLAEVLSLAKEHQVDAVIGFGGGSPVGMAKAVAAALEEKRLGRPARAAFPTEQPLVPVI